jgi:hypothetical protein
MLTTYYLIVLLLVSLDSGSWSHLTLILTHTPSATSNASSRQPTLRVARLHTRLGGRNLSTLGTFPPRLILHPLIDNWLQLRIEVGAVECDFLDED